jgi:hypothetical protein
LELKAASVCLLGNLSLHSLFNDASLRLHRSGGTRLFFYNTYIHASYTQSGSYISICLDGESRKQRQGQGQLRSDIVPSFGLS